ncbi:hypothetical protein LCGC14_1869400 [marine sediment metagenome]|uniref:Thymidylate kinase-like domain-containing protein n=1 Tax=marine sediment metagenome TaxID=412755 RepID=A0A0F9IJI1_9ZZZZ
MIVVIEGGDGAGKTEVAKAIVKMLDADVFIHFPDDNAVTGPLIRSYLKGGWQVLETATSNSEIARTQSALAFQSLNIANRMEHMPEIKNCASQPEQHAVLVRYWQSGWVYGQLDGLDPGWLHDIHTSMVLGGGGGSGLNQRLKKPCFGGSYRAAR